MSSVVYKVCTRTLPREAAGRENYISTLEAGRAARPQPENVFIGIGVTPERCRSYGCCYLFGALRRCMSHLRKHQLSLIDIPKLTTHVYKVLLRPVFLVTSSQYARLFTCIDSHVFVWSIPSGAGRGVGCLATGSRRRLLLVHSSRC